MEISPRVSAALVQQQNAGSNASLAYELNEINTIIFTESVIEYYEIKFGELQDLFGLGARFRILGSMPCLIQQKKPRLPDGMLGTDHKQRKTARVWRHWDSIGGKYGK